MFVAKNKKIIILSSILVILLIAIAFNFLRKDSKEVKSSNFFNTVKEISQEEKKEKYHLKTNFIQQYGEIPFNVYADGTIAYDFDSGEILYQKLQDMKLPTASISKVMTALIVLENSKTDNLITVSKNAEEQIPNKADLKDGEKLTVDELLYALMMLSANDAAYALAEGTLGYDEFVKKMNEKAEWLGLKNTKFTNPAGFDDPEHKSTAYDLGVITRYAIKNHPEILKYMGTLEYSIQKSDRNEPHYLYHLSGLLKSYQGMDGAKTGLTWEAGNTFIGTAKRDGKRIVIVIFNTHSAGEDIGNVLNYGFRNMDKISGIK